MSWKVTGVSQLQNRIVIEDELCRKLLGPPIKKQSISMLHSLRTKFVESSRACYISVVGVWIHEPRPPQRD